MRNSDYSKALFWLGIKPLDFDELHELLTNIYDNQLITIIEELQTKYLISPIKEAGCFVLTEGGQEFARLVMSLGVWDVNKWMKTVAMIALKLFSLILPWIKQNY